MGYTGINLENVKVSNRSAILKLLNDRGAMSRKDIALELGLTPATVTLICTPVSYTHLWIMRKRSPMAEARISIWIPRKAPLRRRIIPRPFLWKTWPRT